MSYRFLRVLHLEDSREYSELLASHLTASGYNLSLLRIDTPEATRNALRDQAWDIILADYSMLQFNAVDALSILKESGLDIPFIIISAAIGEDLAVQAMLAGTRDYVMKDNPARLLPAIERELQEAEMRRTRRQVETEARKLYVEVAAQKRRLNTIIANVPGIVWEVWHTPDSSGRLGHFISDHVESLLGYTAQELLSQPGKALEVIHPEDRPIALASAAEVRRNRSGRLEMRCIHKNGTILWLESKYAAIEDVYGKPLGIRGVSIDVSERKRVELAFQESEDRYRVLFESTPHPTCVIDKETLQFTAVNRAMIEHYGYSPEELLSMTVRNLHQGEEVQTVMKRLSAESGPPGRSEFWAHYKKDGTPLQVQVTFHPLFFRNRASYILQMNDVTQEKQLEQQYLRAQKMEAIGRLAAEIAHDFNNLLTVVSVSADNLNDQETGSDAFAENLRQIHHATDRGINLVQDLMAFSRAPSQTAEVLRLNDAIRSSMPMLKILAGNDIRIQANLDAGECLITIEPGRVEQILMNLVTNSRDAMLNGGVVTISTASVDIDKQALNRHLDLIPGRYVRLRVADTGEGMPPEIQSHIFEPFFTTKRPGQGTGLGLATVYGIVRQHHGHISVESVPDQCTVFTIFWPAAPQKAGGVRTMTSLAGRHGREHILLVDDEPTLLASMRRILERNGYLVIIAANAREALQAGNDCGNAIDLLLTDITLPEMKGPELAQILLQRHPRLHVLYMSGYDGDEVLARDVHFIPKPFRRDALIGKVREILDGH